MLRAYPSCGSDGSKAYRAGAGRPSGVQCSLRVYAALIRTRKRISSLGTDMRSRSVAACAVLVVTGSLLAASSQAQGSTPNGGTLTNTGGDRTWTGGPFLAPNATGNAGAVNCTVPQSCDDYAL